MGFMLEAEAYTSFIFERVAEAKARKGALPIMFTIRGETEIPEMELSHFDGYQGSKPVRIGNGAASHIQLVSTRAPKNTREDLLNCVIIA